MIHYHTPYTFFSRSLEGGGGGEQDDYTKVSFSR